MKKGFCTLIYFVIVTCSFMLACSKATNDPNNGGGGGPHDFVPTDTLAPQVIIYTPSLNQVFSNGNVINITGKTTDDFGLYRGTIKITDDASGMVMLNQPYEIHGYLLYNFNLNYTASVITPSNYTVTVSFEDHGNNVTSKSVKVKLNP